MNHLFREDGSHIASIETGFVGLFEEVAIEIANGITYTLPVHFWDESIIEAAHEDQEFVNGEWVYPEDYLDKLKTQAVAKIDARHDQMITKLVGNPSQSEINTWPEKVRVAKEYIEGDEDHENALLSMRDSEDADKTAEQMALKIIGKSNLYGMVIFPAAAIRGTAKNNIKAATTAEEIENILNALMTEDGPIEAAKTAYVQALETLKQGL